MKCILLIFIWSSRLWSHKSLLKLFVNFLCNDHNHDTVWSLKEIILIITRCFSIFSWIELFSKLLIPRILECFFWVGNYIALNRGDIICKCSNINLHFFPMIFMKWIILKIINNKEFSVFFWFGKYIALNRGDMICKCMNINLHFPPIISSEFSTSPEGSGC